MPPTVASSDARSLEVLLSPPELDALRNRDLADTTCVVFDILRATTTMIEALANGATAVIPVAEINEALAIHETNPGILLAGERDGLRIGSDLTGGVEFDLGNSPREFIGDVVRGRTIVMTTTNGTRAIRACAGAREVLIASFLNLRATATYLRGTLPHRLILACSGTRDRAALEDALAAGALCERVRTDYLTGDISDSAEMVRRLYPLLQTDLAGAMRFSTNGRRLLQHPELKGDVSFCVQKETANLVAALGSDGAVRAIGGTP
jgi:2-phosphosulfolactate phosphatase